MNLDETQKSKVVKWIQEGLKLSEIQTRLSKELGVTMTYMDVRLMVDDLKLTPKDTERAEKGVAGIGTVEAQAPSLETRNQSDPDGSKAAGPASGGVAVSVDQIARVGAVVSGKVTFSDGNQAEWYFDQTGRLGMVPQQQGYRPSSNDLQRFQTLLEAELARIGY